MGFSEKTQVEGGFDSDNRKWVVAGIALRTQLKPIYTKSLGDQKSLADGDKLDCMDSTADADDERPTTPRDEGAKIPTKLTCPPAPRKRKSSYKCSYGGDAREFFTPPDLETVFLRHA